MPYGNVILSRVRHTLRNISKSGILFLMLLSCSENRDSEKVRCDNLKINHDSKKTFAQIPQLDSKIGVYSKLNNKSDSVITTFCLKYPKELYYNKMLDGYIYNNDTIITYYQYRYTDSLKYIENTIGFYMKMDVIDIKRIDISNNNFVKSFMFDTLNIYDRLKDIKNKLHKNENNDMLIIYRYFGCESTFKITSEIYCAEMNQYNNDLIRLIKELQALDKKNGYSTDIYCN